MQAAGVEAGEGLPYPAGCAGSPTRAGDPSGWNLPRDIRHDIYSKRG